MCGAAALVNFTAEWTCPTRGDPCTMCLCRRAYRYHVAHYAMHGEQAVHVDHVTFIPPPPPAPPGAPPPRLAVLSTCLPAWSALAAQVNCCGYLPSAAPLLLDASLSLAAPPLAAGCKDEKSACQGWAEGGECESNPGFMVGTKDAPGACLLRWARRLRRAPRRSSQEQRGAAPRWQGRGAGSSGRAVAPASQLSSAAPRACPAAAGGVT